MAAPGTDAASLQRLAAARAAVQCLQSLHAHRVAMPAGRPAAAAAPSRDGSSRGSAAPPLALRRRRPQPLAAFDPVASAARRIKWSAVARRQRGWSSGSSKSLEGVVMLERESASGDNDDEGSDVPAFDGLAADASTDRRDSSGPSSVTARWFANSGKAHTYDVRALGRLFRAFAAPPGFAPRRLRRRSCRRWRAWTRPAWWPSRS